MGISRSNLNMGDVIDVYPYKGEVRNHETGELLATFELKTDVLIVQHAPDHKNLRHEKMNLLNEILSYVHDE